MENQVVRQSETDLKYLMERTDVRDKFEKMLGKKAQGFITSVLQISASNELLKNADPMSIYQAAMVAATLDLPLNNNLGFAYIVPYNQSYKDGNGNWQKKQVAQFQMGYKGFIQLAQRSGQFRKINACIVYDGQVVDTNPLRGYKFDFTKKSSIPIGYASYFELINGFENVLYMDKEQMEKHAKRYSQTYKNDKGRWHDDFDTMALKTVLKLALSKYAPLSIDYMYTAALADQSIVRDAENKDFEYVDNDSEQLEDESVIVYIEKLLHNSSLPTEKHEPLDKELTAGVTIARSKEIIEYLKENQKKTLEQQVNQIAKP